MTLLSYHNPKIYQGEFFTDINPIPLEELEPSRKEKIVAAFMRIVGRN